MTAIQDNDDADAALGASVRATLNKGRQRAIDAKRAALAPRERVVRNLFDIDIIDGQPALGRARRIAERAKIPRRTVSRILRKLLGQSREAVPLKML
jgi:hypothetical protein